MINTSSSINDLAKSIRIAQAQLKQAHQAYVTQVKPALIEAHTYYKTDIKPSVVEANAFYKTSIKPGAKQAYQVYNTQLKPAYQQVRGKTTKITTTTLPNNNSNIKSFPITSSSITGITGNNSNSITGGGGGGNIERKLKNSNKELWWIDLD